MHDSPEDKKIVESIKHHYLNILEREPDDMGLRSYLKQIKDNTINIDDLPKILKESKEYLFAVVKEPIDAAGGSLEQKIKNEWDARAKIDPLYSIYTDAKDAKQFWNSGEHDVRGIIKSDKEFFQILTKGKPKSMKILEIGCGIGRLLIPMSKIFGEVIGVDVSPEMIRIGKEYTKNISNCKLFENNGRDLSMFSDNSFDFCYSHFVFQHIPDIETIKNYLLETARILKKDSLFKVLIRNKTNDDDTVISTWNGIRFSVKTNGLGKVTDVPDFSNLAKEFNFEQIELSGRNPIDTTSLTEPVDSTLLTGTPGFTWITLKLIQ